jgi:hypothetical protein
MAGAPGGGGEAGGGISAGGLVASGFEPNSLERKFMPQMPQAGRCLRNPKPTLSLRNSNHQADDPIPSR